MPRAVQLAAALYRDDLVFRAARALERAAELPLANPAKTAFHRDDKGRLRPMRLVTFRYPSKLGTHIGALRDDGAVLDLAAADPALAGGHMPSFIAGGAAALQHAKAAVARAPVAEGAILCAPIPRPPKNIFCVGKNYHEHAKEFAGSGFDSQRQGGWCHSDAPIVFTKVPECVIADRRRPSSSDPDVSDAIDYEAELAVVIGRGGRGIRRRRRDGPRLRLHHRQRRDRARRAGRHQQWDLGK